MNKLRIFGNHRLEAVYQSVPGDNNKQVVSISWTIEHYSQSFWLYRLAYLLCLLALEMGGPMYIISWPRQPLLTCALGQFANTRSSSPSIGDFGPTVSHLNVVGRASISLARAITGDCGCNFMTDLIDRLRISKLLCSTLSLVVNCKLHITLGSAPSSHLTIDRRQCVADYDVHWSSWRWQL